MRGKKESKIIQVWNGCTSDGGANVLQFEREPNEIAQILGSVKLDICFPDREFQRKSSLLLEELLRRILRYKGELGLHIAWDKAIDQSGLINALEAHRGTDFCSPRADY